uniref:Glycerol-3-phosphate acyltransferase n=1 Tax=Anthurium amnicola TaxID=1678845 RepID=A0A1D1XGX1_9ARAE
MNFDIVPRIFLAPLQSIKMDFQAILHILYSKSFCFGLNFVENSQLVTFFTTVLRNSQSIATHCACLFMRCTNPLLATFTGLTQLSPYRPFGEYVFCTSDRSPVVVKNSEAVLQLLLYALQPGHEQEVVEAAHGSVKEHLVYESAMQKNFKMPDVVYLDHLDAVPPSLSDAGSEEIQLVGTLFEDLRLSAEARLCLHAAGEQEKQRQRNLVTVDTTYSKIVDALRFLSEYQERCMNRGLGYYDTFKVQNHSDDFNANVKRMELAGLWDQIVEMVRRYELPCSFESQEKWVNLGTCYRRLVEPLDIANYYRHAKNEDTGPYLLKGRPSRYKYTQAWLEYTHQMPRGSSSESCFWAKVEELCIGSNKGKPYLEMEGRITELEEEAKHWRSRGLLKEDVFLEDSTFVKWWKTLPGAHRLKSHIRICSQPLSNGQGLS